MHDISLDEKYKLGRKLEPLGLKVICSLACFLSFIYLGYSLWILDRGFDLFDESYYLLLAKNPDAVLAYNSAQHWVTAGVWRLMGTLTGFRLAGLLILLTAATLLSIGSLSALKKFDEPPMGYLVKSAVISSSWIAAMMYGCTINFSPSYNLLATAGAYAALGLIFYAYSLPAAFLNKKMFFYFVSALPLSVEVISKGSAGIATLIMLLSFLAACETSTKIRLYGALSIVFGLLFSLLILTLINTSFDRLIDSFLLGMSMFKQVQTESVTERVWRYIMDAMGGYHSLVNLFWSPIILGLIYAVYKKHFFGVIAIGAIVAVLVFDNQIKFTAWSYHETVTTLLLLVLMTVVGAYETAFSDYQKRWVLGMLLLLPYTVAFGSGNSIYTQVIISLGSWGVMIAILATHGPNKKFWYLQVLWVFFLALSVFLGIKSGFGNPHNTYAPIVDGVNEVTIDSIGTIKVSSENKKFINSINDAVQNCHIPPNTPYLGLYHNPGIALLLDATPPVTPWINNLDQANQVLAHAERNVINAAVIGLHVNQDGWYMPIPENLSNFPSEYKLCGSAVYPWQKRIFQIWSPK